MGWLIDPLHIPLSNSQEALTIIDETLREQGQEWISRYTIEQLREEIVQAEKIGRACELNSEKLPSVVRKLLDWRLDLPENSRLINNLTNSTSLRPALIVSWATPVDFETRVAASATDPVQFELACWEADIFLQRPEPLPDIVRDFISDILKGRISSPKKRGKHPAAYFGRDSAVVDLLKGAITQGLTATRNDATASRDSACDIVAEVLSDRGLSPATYESAKRVWLNRDRRGAYFEHKISPMKGH